MRASDKILVADIREALEKVTNKHDFKRAEKVLADAESGYFNDYFGDCDNPQAELISAFKYAGLDALIPNVLDGKYDGTKEESDEWMRSDEGQEVYRQLIDGN